MPLRRPRALCALCCVLASGDISVAVAGDGTEPGGWRGLRRWGVTAPAARSRSAYALWLTDVHADPFYNSSLQICKDTAAVTAAAPYGVMGCDPPYSLWQSAVAAAADVSRNVSVDFVLFTGDFMRHGQDRLPQAAHVVSEVVANTTATLREYFPATPLVPAVTAGAMGNDDSPANYELNITTGDVNPWLQTLGRILGGFGVVPPEALPSYELGGYHERRLGAVTLLTINTLAYSRFRVPQFEGPLPEDPFRQFQWLRERIAAAAAERRYVWIAGHIPPGTETYGYTALWHAQYVASYLKVVEDPALAPWVAAQLFGHVHAEEFRLLAAAPDSAGPVLLAGAVSPVFKSNPSFRLLEFEAATGRLLGFRVYWAELPSLESGHPPLWRDGYDAAEVYPPLRRALEEDGALTQRGFRQLAASLAGGGEDWRTFVSWYKTQVANDLSGCNITETMSGHDVACLKDYMNSLTISAEDEAARPEPVRAHGPETLRAPGGFDPDAFYRYARAMHMAQL